jgi:hypothetical protein
MLGYDYFSVKSFESGEPIEVYLSSKQSEDLHGLANVQVVLVAVIFRYKILILHLSIFVFGLRGLVCL